MILLFLAIVAADVPAEAPAFPGEDPVEPYVQSNANAGAAPFTDPAVFAAFHGREGIARVVRAFIQGNTTDPRIADIFRGQDLVRLERVLNEQFCYILGGGCTYTGRDMAAAHKNLGVQTADFNAIVENLQRAMNAEGVPFHTQNRFLAKLAPMHRETVER